MRPENLEWIAKLRGCDVQDIITYASYKPKVDYQQHMYPNKSALKLHAKSGGNDYIACAPSEHANELVW